MFLNILSIVVFLIVAIGLIWLAVEKENILFCILGVVLLFILLCGKFIVYEDLDNKITVIEEDIVLNEYDISNDSKAIDKAYELNQSSSNGRIFPILNINGDLEYKFIKYGDNVKIIEGAKDNYIKEYKAKKVSTINPNISKLEKFLIAITSFKKVEDIKIINYSSEVYYKVYLN